MKPINAADGAILPSSELEVMSAIWQAYEKKGGTPVTTREMIACAPALSRLSMTTILTLVMRLAAKGFISVQKVGGEETARKLNMYTPILSYGEYRKRAYRDFIEKIFRGDRTALARILLEGMSGEELKKVREIVRWKEYGIYFMGRTVQDIMEEYGEQRDEWE